MEFVAYLVGMAIVPTHQIMLSTQDVADAGWQRNTVIRYQGKLYHWTCSPIIPRGTAYLIDLSAFEIGQPT